MYKYHRKWMNNDIDEKAEYIITKIPLNIFEHALNLIEIMSDDPSEDYFCRIVSLIYEAVTETKFCFHCDKTEHYNYYHEFCIYLDGWVWKINGDDAETGNITLEPLK